jgi:hypothetical protein
MEEEEDETCFCCFCFCCCCCCWFCCLLLVPPSSLSSSLPRSLFPSSSPLPSRDVEAYEAFEDCEGRRCCFIDDDEASTLAALPAPVSGLLRLSALADAPPADFELELELKGCCREAVAPLFLANPPFPLPDIPSPAVGVETAALAYFDFDEL